MAHLTAYPMHTQQLIAEGKLARATLRQRLQAAGFTGWTERDVRGFWLGEPVPDLTEFEIQTEADATAALADALIAAHRWAEGVYQLTHIAPDGSRTLYEVRDTAPTTEVAA